MSKALATIRTDSDVSLDYEEAKAEGFYTQEAYDLFKQLEFKQMLNRFEKKEVSRDSDIRETFRKLEDQGDFIKWLKKRKADASVGLYLAMDGNELLAAAASTGEETLAYVLPVQENVQLSLFEEFSDN